MKRLIDKSAVVAKINRVLNSYDPNEITSGRYALVDLRDFLDTLEEKEVDLNEETLHSELRKIYASVYDSKDIEAAKHFFELGLKASNPLTWEDIETIGKLRLEVALEFRKKELDASKSIKFTVEKFCSEVLKRFKAQKGE